MLCLKQHNENHLFAKYGFMNLERFSGVIQTSNVLQLNYVHVTPKSTVISFISRQGRIQKAIFSSGSCLFYI